MYDLAIKKHLKTIFTANKLQGGSNMTGSDWQLWFKIMVYKKLFKIMVKKNQSRSYLNHLVHAKILLLFKMLVLGNVSKLSKLIF